MAITDLSIKASRNTPSISFCSETGVLYLKGKSIPENATRVFKPATEWIKEYRINPAEETNLHFDLMYFNTASSIWIIRMIKLLSEINDPERLLIIHLYFHIEEFDEMDQQDLADAISPISDVLSEATVSMGVKVYGKDDSDSVVKEKLILL